MDTTIKAALAGAANRMRRRIDQLEDIVFETAACGKLVFLNAAWQKNLGHQAADCLGLPFRTFVHEADQPACDDLMHDSPAKKAGPAKIRLYRVDGSISWMNISASPLPDGGLVGALHRITAATPSVAELAKIPAVPSHTDHMVIITDQRGITEWVNEAFTKRSGYTLEDMAGKSAMDLLQGPDSHPATLTRIRKCLLEGRSVGEEILNYNRSGESYWIWTQFTPIRGPWGDIEHFIAIQTESSEIHHTRQELQDAKDIAEAANAAKNRSLAIISHEMRSSLQAILGAAELGIDTVGIPESVHKLLTTIDNTTNILLRFINDLLDISRIETGMIHTVNIPFNLRSCIDTALATTAESARAKSLAFEIDVEDSLPATILGDPDRLHQIVVNLAQNAVKFTEKGTVTIQLSGNGGHFEISVRDTGCGIAAEEQSRIFQLFTQVGSSTVGRNDGAGLGLNIVKSLVEALDGEIVLHSSPGDGSDFRVRLPLKLPCLEPLVGDKKDIPPDQPARMPPPVTILVADDDDVSFEILELVLITAGFRVSRAKNGKEAILGAAAADMILMDIEMPEMDGLEATRRIRQAEQLHGSPPVPIMALTAHAAQGYRERCLAAGCTGYITKPIRMKALLASIQACF